MEGTNVNSMDREMLMASGNNDLYLGDRRLLRNRLPAEKAPCPKFCLRAQTACEELSCVHAMQVFCCKRHGRFGTQVDNVNEVQEARWMYHLDLNPKDKQNYLTELFEDRLRRGSWEVRGQPLCFMGVCLLLGISKGCLQKAKNRAVFGIVKAKDLPGLKPRIKHVTNGVISWLSDFVLRYTERLPHKSHLNLPSSFTKVEGAALCRQQLKFRYQEDE